METNEKLKIDLALSLNEVVLLEMLLEKKLLDLPQGSQSYIKVSNLLQRFFTEMSGASFAIKSMEVQDVV
jgi:hypothetical protein